MLTKRWKAAAFIATTISLVLVLSIVLMGLPQMAQSSKEDDFQSLKKANRAFVDVINQAKPAVVTIGTTQKVKIKDPFENFRDSLPWFSFPESQERERKISGLGSGVIIRKDGHILTNNHVIKNAEEITVILADSREFDAKVVGRDVKTDLAVIKIEGSDLPTLPLGDSDQLQVGEWVVAIGSPFGFVQTVSRGIVSATGRDLYDVRILDPQLGYGDFIQTDASINRGNSGGALINIYGELVGINTAIVGGRISGGGNVGVGFAISINLAKKIMNQLIDKGKVERAWLGVWIQPITYELAQKLKLENIEGALVTEVRKDTPAEKAGVKARDVIVEFDGIKIENSTHLRNIVSTSPIGKKVDTKVIRDGKEMSLEVKLGALPDDSVARARHDTPGTYTSSDFGLSVQNLTKELAERFGYEDEDGVLISEVESDGPADDAGLKEGNLIQEVENQPVKNIKQYEKQMEKVDADSVLLRVRHPSGRTNYFVLNN